MNRSTSAESMNGPQSPESYTSNSPASVYSDATTTSNSNSISNGGFPVTQFSFTPEGWFDEPPRVSVPGAKCQVCGELAGKHSAYGGRVCPSCRAFFRRSVQTKYYEIFACSKGEKCTITLSSRKTCKYCRFKKCLQVRFQSTKLSNFVRIKKHPFSFVMHEPPCTQDRVFICDISHIKPKYCWIGQYEFQFILLYCIVTDNAVSAKSTKYSFLFGLWLDLYWFVNQFWKVDLDWQP